MKVVSKEEVLEELSSEGSTPETYTGRYREYVEKSLENEGDDVAIVDRVDRKTVQGVYTTFRRLGLNNRFQVSRNKITKDEYLLAIVPVGPDLSKARQYEGKYRSFVEEVLEMEEKGETTVFRTDQNGDDLTEHSSQKVYWALQQLGLLEAYDISRVNIEGDNYSLMVRRTE